MNLHATPLKEILANQIQQCIKRIAHSDQVGFILSIQDWFKIPKINYKLKKKTII